MSFEREVSDLETDLEAVEACRFEPEVYRAMSDHNGQRQCQKTTIVEARKDSVVLTGETLRGAVPILQSITETKRVHSMQSIHRSCNTEAPTVLQSMRVDFFLGVHAHYFSPVLYKKITF